MASIYSTIKNDAGPFTSEICDTSWLSKVVLPHMSNEPDLSDVYFTPRINPNVLLSLYKNEYEIPSGVDMKSKFTAIKLSTGEKGGVYYLNPNLIKPIIDYTNGNIIECNTAYRGKRFTTANHYRTAVDHGFTQITEVDIMDANGKDINLPVPEGSFRLSVDKVGAHLTNYNNLLVLSHGKGHAMAGCGGALKNISIGIASSRGKSLIHTGGESETGIGIDVDPTIFQESMAEAAAAVWLHFKPNAFFITVINNVSKDCDCIPHPAKPEIPDIGIIASKNPVALDQCMIDMFLQYPGNVSIQKRILDRRSQDLIDHIVTLKGIDDRANYYHLVYR